MQWQHGTYEKKANGELHLTPIKVDGRQLLSDPCTYKNSIYTRYNATEKFKVRSNPPFHPIPHLTANTPQQYQVQLDAYRVTVKRLDLYQADGAPVMPLYLAYTPPKMLPTTTLNPLVTATPAAGGKSKRDAVHEVLFKRTTAGPTVRADNWWWFGVFMTAGGGVLYWFF
jgi:hypothetical protein